MPCSPCPPSLSNQFQFTKHPEPTKSQVENFAVQISFWWITAKCSKKALSNPGVCLSCLGSSGGYHIYKNRGFLQAPKLLCLFFHPLHLLHNRETKNFFLWSWTFGARKEHCYTFLYHVVKAKRKKKCLVYNCMYIATNQILSYLLSGVHADRIALILIKFLSDNRGERKARS